MLIDYKTLDGANEELIAKAENLRKVIAEAINGKENYKLLGLRETVTIFPAGTTKITLKVKPLKKIKNEEQAVEDLTTAQRGLFQNLNNLKSLDAIKEFENRFVVTDDETGNMLLIIVSKNKDSLGRLRIRKLGIIFREYTQQEEEEFLEKQALKETANLGMTEDEEDDDDLLFGADF